MCDIIKGSAVVVLRCAKKRKENGGSWWLGMEEGEGVVVVKGEGRGEGRAKIKGANECNKC